MIITIGSKVKDGEGNTYTLTEELGHGGFGCVYKAEWMLLQSGNVIVIFCSVKRQQLMLSRLPV